jgi:hypothetical protein
MPKLTRSSDFRTAINGFLTKKDRRAASYERTWASAFAKEHEALVKDMGHELALCTIDEALKQSMRRPAASVAQLNIPGLEEARCPQWISVPTDDGTVAWPSHKKATLGQWRIHLKLLRKSIAADVKRADDVEAFITQGDALNIDEDKPLIPALRAYGKRRRPRRPPGSPPDHRPSP